MLLLELREIIDRHGNYGQWFNTQTGQALPVKDLHGHFAYLQDYQHELFPEEDEGEHGVTPSASSKLYQLAFENDFVRITHYPASDVIFQGTPRALKRAHAVIRSTAAQADVGRIMIEAVETNMHPINTKSFNMLSSNPNDIVEFIKTL